ncbi:replication restart helicase PriA [Bacilliculturomica massiliensis]|uniref:replication restart helicase PriA n=1 Tax=Bacilliculturomica massiliensis TaxID=1917867 RepID=UPI001031EF0F|nr:primosomal protein N' [Bacilliculturomica massiliensis]
MKYVNVVIDNSSDSTDGFYTYGSEDESIQIGDKVQVSFARGKKLRDAYVFEVMDELPSPVKGLKYIAEKDPEVCLGQEAVATCRWMRSRYLCRYIDAVKCFTPAGSPSKRGKKRNPLGEAQFSSTEARALTEEQQKAMDAMEPVLGKGVHQVFLINGVTSSGKTELYMQAIARVIEAGKTAIMLVPEISLTTQTIERFIGRFGAENTAVLHSKLSLGQRYDEWMRVKKGEVKIVIGARSAVFAPLSHIGIIVLDEEHETTYKSDMSPKYDTAEVAIKRAMLHGAAVLLGSATPSLQTAYRSRNGIFTELTLKQRYNKTPLPQVEIVDMREELLAGNKSIFSRELFRQISGTLEKKQQVILFLNRRGYSTFVSCRTCGYVVRCPDCGISMTYHKDERSCICHFCGKRQTLPELCPDCGGKYIRYFGTGTEKVEEAVKEMFPEAAAARLDLDTARKKGSADKILKDFRRGKTDILIGTQLVAKGLDFAGVGLVGVVSADVSLNIPDFRAPERTFQLITQAAGRAGRGNDPGTVIIQTYTPDHYAVTCASHHDYEAFYSQEIRLRRQINYPPFCDLFQLIVSAEKESDAAEAAGRAAEMLRRLLAGQKRPCVMGPNPAPMNKINGFYRYQILMKAPAGTRRAHAAAVMEMKQELFVKKKTDVLLTVDINPFSFI